MFTTKYAIRVSGRASSPLYSVCLELWSQGLKVTTQITTLYNNGTAETSVTWDIPAVRDSDVTPEDSSPAQSTEGSNPAVKSDNKTRLRGW